MTNSPSPEQVNRKIADVLGEKFCACKTPVPFYSPPAARNTLCCGNCKGLIIPIDRATNRDESYKLIANINFTPFDYEVMSAYDESLLYLETEGWRWADCSNCEGRGVQPMTDSSGEMDGPACRHCNGEGGEWVKV